MNSFFTICLNIVATAEFKVRPSIDVVLKGLMTSWNYEWEDNKGITNQKVVGGIDRFLTSVKLTSSKFS
jgi:hypothetical protein